MRLLLIGLFDKKTYIISCLTLVHPLIICQAACKTKTVAVQAIQRVVDSGDVMTMKTGEMFLDLYTFTWLLWMQY